tara:strand:+ start:64579 stop:66060 length:1482 start_codon:yes stop_codon:yes gene_type:complete
MNINNIAVLLSLFALITSCSAPVQEEVPSPNIIVILADDLGYGDLSFYNKASKISTPHIDQLAKGGIHFTDAHSAGEWCTPSRYGLITGTYPARIELNWRERSLIGDDQATLATMLKSNGYQTACVGKWHLGFDDLNWENPGEMETLSGGPIEHGFDYFFGMHASLDIPPYFYLENDRIVEKATGFVDDHASPDATTVISGAFYRAGASAPGFKHDDVLDVFFDKAKAFISGHLTAAPDKPFFLYLPLTAPHTPWLPKESYRGKSGAGEYGDFVMQVDDLVGQVTDLLDQKGITENTLIVFSSDNGPVWFEADIDKFGHDSKAGLKGMKIDQWEGGSRIPLIFNWKNKIPSGQSSDQLIGVTDMMATLASVAGGSKLDSGFDSKDFTPVLYGQATDNIRDGLVIGNSIYRKGDIKLIVGSGLGSLSRRYDPDGVYLPEADNQGEIYNLKDDPFETNNLFTSESNLYQELKAEFEGIIARNKKSEQDHDLPAVK